MFGPSLRLRLTIVATAILATGLLLFGLLVSLTLARTVDLEIDRSLADRARVVIASISVNVTPDGLQVQLPDVDAIAAGGAVVQVTGFDGTVVRSASLGTVTLPVSVGARTNAARGQVWFETIETEGVSLRLHAAPLVWRGDTLGVLLVARPIGPSELVLGGLRIVLVGVGATVLVIGGLLAWFVARRALRPIDDFAREAGAIGIERDFSRRLSTDVVQSATEVGRLGTTFNTMLDRLQEAYGAVQLGSHRLEAMLQSQRRFVADASHELRTPLTTIRGNADLLRRGVTLTADDTREMIGQISDEADRMARLVGDLLTLARADGGIRTAYRPVMLRPLVESVAFQARNLGAGRLHVSVIPYIGDGDLETVGDADALRQLLLALIDNAIKYTPDGGTITLGLSTAHAKNTGDGAVITARISVMDTGLGIRAEDLPHIFERFFRADRARHTAGSGLGLAIGKEVAQAHGGEIAVESSVGAGSMFTVSLPARMVSGTVDPEPFDAHPDPN